MNADHDPSDSSDPSEGGHVLRPDAVSDGAAGIDRAAAGSDESIDFDAVAGFDPVGAGIDMGALFEQATKMQEQILAAQEQAAEAMVEGVAGGGAVRITVSGTMEFQSVTIEPSAVDPDDVEMLQDLVLAALHDAVTQVGELQQGSMGLGNLDLGDLLGG